jgi:Icc-related predicted phosphoesterase
MRQFIWRMMPGLWLGGGVDLIVAHAPPRHIGDAEDRCHRGFDCFVNLIGRFKPRYFMHGHIHAHFDGPYRRVIVVGHTRVINAFGYTILEIDHGPFDKDD